MRHMTLTAGPDVTKRLIQQMETSQIEMRRQPMELRITAQLRGIHNIHLHVVSGWEAGFTTDNANKMRHVVGIMESTNRILIRYYDARCNPLKERVTMRGELKQWRSHKVVRAGKIQTVERIEEHGQFMVRITTDCGVVVDENSKPWLDRLPSQMLGGYYVLYEDGYTSWSPAKAFEEGNSPLEVEPPTAGVAVEHSPLNLYATLTLLAQSKLIVGKKVRGILSNSNSILDGGEYQYMVDQVHLTPGGTVMEHDGKLYMIRRVSQATYDSLL